MIKAFGIPNGGQYVAAMMGNPVENPADAEIFVDDIIDSGKTRDEWAKRFPNVPFIALVDKTRKEDQDLGWVVFPWEAARKQRLDGPEDSVVRLLQYIGEKPERDGLKDTPSRVLRAYREMTTGYEMDPAAILARCFDVAHDEMVVLRGIRFTSLCEHHLLPFTGEAAVGYIPGEKIVGISKLARVVECFSKRLQVQERMTQQIAEAIQEALNPIGVGVVVRAHHACMGCRGVVQPEAEMLTSCMLGKMRERPEARAELMGLIR
jgi:GTP cyclohydrolase I